MMCESRNNSIRKAIFLALFVCSLEVGSCYQNSTATATLANVSVLLLIVLWQVN